MISPFAYARFHSTISPMVHQALKKDSLTDDQYAMCSPILMGFAIDRKIWGMLFNMLTLFESNILQVNLP